MTDHVIIREQDDGHASVTVNGCEVVRTNGSLHTWPTVHHAWVFLWRVQKSYQRDYGDTLDWQIQIKGDST